jgi:oligopeptide/dipeptide ABC transporter ATP-binding protein
MHDLVQEHRIGVMLITHNLGVVAQLCSHVAVMYAGNIVEAGGVRSVLKSPVHPYTRALLGALPTARVQRGELRGIEGGVPNLLAPPPGCRFSPRCPHAQARCSAARPATVEVGPAHSVACVLAHAPASEAA